MAKQINKTVIGGFVVSAIAMLIGSVILLGGGELFKKTVKYVMFFDGSVKGLSVGAPVVWSGVEIGSVTKVVVDYDVEKLKVDIPVIIELDPSLIKVRGKVAENLQERGKRMKQLIERGMRAQLSLQSMVTGQMMIALDFYPDTPVNLTGIKSEYVEIPTIPSAMDEFAEKLEKLPIDKIANKLVDVLNNIDKVVGGPEIKDILNNIDAASKNLNQATLDAGKLIADADDRVKKVSDSLLVTSGDAQEFLVDARKLVNNVDGQVQPVSDKAQAALVSAREAMDQAKTTLAGIDNFVGERSETRRKLDRALDEIATAARSMNSLMDYLERHPESVLKGKGNGGG